MTPRKIIQISSASFATSLHSSGGHVITVLCDDGTLWIIDTWQPLKPWEQLPPIPEPGYNPDKPNPTSKASEPPAFIPPPPSFEWAEFQAKANKAIEDMLSEKHIAIENLTKDQFVKALRQAIACGDFTRNVLVNSDKQSVDYVPFRREAELLAKIRFLEDEISRA